MISVIIPLAPQEDKWKELVPQLNDLPEGSEIILVTGIGMTIDVSDFENVKVVEGRSGRAGRMNCGVDNARNECLWFLHADTKRSPDATLKLVTAFKQKSDVLYYSDLKFLDDGPKMMRMNECFVKWRSDLLKIPFGDQGFAISKTLFLEMGGYREDVPYGEDHIFTWKLKQEGFQINRMGSSISTSSRKYQKGGWGRITTLHVFLTIKQGWPEFLLWIRKRFL